MINEQSLTSDDGFAVLFQPNFAMSAEKLHFILIIAVALSIDAVPIEVAV